MQLPELSVKRAVIGVLLAVMLFLVVSFVLFGGGSEEPIPPDQLFTTP